ncbi:MAG: hypothetical protein O7D32_05805 [bacterium]|nr:hypothetical protein [bacterium]
MTPKMTPTSIALLVLAALIVLPTAPNADPILKPRKYHGPIPQKAFTLGIGFYGGADNQELWDYLESLLLQPLKKESVTEDFGASLNLDAMFLNKVHPQFAFRVRGSVAFLNSESKGLLVPSVIDTINQPLVSFSRSMDVILSSVSVSGLYYFHDAAVSEIQIYTGLGFGFVFPYMKYEQDLFVVSTGQPFPSEQQDETQVTAEPEFHAVLGILYHLRPTFALGAEGRFQMAQSKIDLNLPTLSDGRQDLNFDVDLTGFVLALTASWFF